MIYSKITKEQFDEMQFNAGIWVRSFGVTQPSVQPEDVICATSGGISLSVVPSIVDTGDGVYMMPKGTVEMLIVTGWTVEASFTTLGFSGDMIQFVLGASDDNDGISPRLELKDDDFNSLWWIGDRVDGGLVAIHILDALSDEGVDIQTEEHKAGQINVHLTAHSSLDGDMNAVPVEIFSIEGRPMFDVVDHQFLFVYNADLDLFELDENTGGLYITENDQWVYTLNENTGTMEVSKR